MYNQIKLTCTAAISAAAATAVIKLTRNLLSLCTDVHVLVHEITLPRNARYVAHSRDMFYVLYIYH